MNIHMDKLKKNDTAKKEQESSFLKEKKNIDIEFQKRLIEVIGDEPVAAFARRCGFGESLIRKYMDGSLPSVSKLSSMAEASGVTVDWLATGRGIKYARDLKHAQERMNGAPPAVLPELPTELEPYRKRLDALLIYLSMIEDDQERSEIIDSFVLRAQDKIDLNPLKDYFTKAKANNSKK